MKFLALLRKELRESMPYIMIVAALLLGGGLLCINEYLRHRPSFYHPLPSGELVGIRQLGHHVHMNGTGVLILVCSLVLGVGLGILHFWLPQITRTWPFLIHRSASRTRILSAKLCAALIGIPVILGSIWSVLFGHACRVEFGPVVHYRILYEGWIMIGLGFVAYLATACSGLNTHRWHTTKLLSMVLGLCVIIVTFSQWQIVSAVAVMSLGLVILLLQTYVFFQVKQF